MLPGPALRNRETGNKADKPSTMTFLFGIFNSIDGFLRGFLPLWGTLAFWGFIGGSAVMGLYALISPQGRISDKKKVMKEIQERLKDDSIDFAGTLRLSKQNLLRSLELLGLVILPSLASMIPALCMILFVSMLYSYDSPGPQEDIKMKVVPHTRDISIRSGGEVMNTGNDEFLVVMGDDPFVRVYESDRVIYEWKPGRLMDPQVGKRPWWAPLIPKGASYLPEDSQAERIMIGFRELRVIEGASRVLGGWELSYFLSLTIAAVFVKVLFKIH